MARTRSPSWASTPGRASGGTAAGIVGVGAEDVIDAPAAAGLVAEEAGSEGSGNRNAVGAFALVAEADEDVEGGEFADHLGEHVAQLAAVGDAIDEGRYLACMAGQSTWCRPRS